jgi:DNA replication and repair protein RecF
VYVRRLQLKDFRNYSEIDLTLPRGNLVFLGDNAQGKSNLLEAVYLLASARAVRASNDGELISWQAEPEPQPVARVTGAVERREGSLQLEVIIAGSGPAALGPATVRAGKRLRVNGIARRGADFVGLLRAVLFTAEDLHIVTGAPSERRRFLDSMLTQMDRRYYGASQRYARVLQQRNAALKRIKDGLASPDELAFWDESLVAEGAVIVEARLRVCRLMGPLAAEHHHHLSGTAAESLEVEYRPRLGDEGEAAPDGTESLADVTEALKSGQRRLLRREIAAGMSLVGPHRDDLEVRVNAASAAAFASRAQVRTATLALRLAEANLFQEDAGDPPVLLLDDIVSELDERRRRSVLASIADFDQVWFTSTDTHGFEPAFLEGAQPYRVQGAGIFEESGWSGAPRGN